jgi:hypothetical protein
MVSVAHMISKKMRFMIKKQVQDFFKRSRKGGTIISCFWNFPFLQQNIYIYKFIWNYVPVWNLFAIIEVYISSIKYNFSCLRQRHIKKD